MRSLLLIVVIVACACTDRTRPARPVEFEPPASDAGVDMSMVEPDEPDGICDGLGDGTSCAVPNGRGVCARQRCVLVACDSGFADCGQPPGCETDLSTTGDCGACGSSCAPAQRCQQGPGGYVCGAGIVCPADRFDLDGDVSNGCEWRADWGAPFGLDPIDLEIETAEAVGAGYLVAGGAGDARISGLLGAVPTNWPTPRGQARAIAVSLDDDYERVVWTDGVSVRRIADDAYVMLEPPCAPAQTTRRFVAAAGGFVATGLEVFSVETTDCGGEVACLQLVLGLHDYLVNRAADFQPDELAACDACIFAAPSGCAGPAHCTDVDFDDSVCAGCVAAGCPDFQITGMREVDGQLAVVTARGVHLLAPGGPIVAGWEAPFDPSTGGGPRFVGAVSGTPAPLVLLHSRGFARHLGADLRPTMPDLGLPFDPEAASVVAFDGLLVAAAAGEGILLQPGPRSGRNVVLEMKTAPGVGGLTPTLATAAADAAVLLYSAPGLVYPRTITRN